MNTSFKVKIGVSGDKGVGKTSLIHQVSQLSFHDDLKLIHVVSRDEEQI
jgi:GTPase SAR1 family protein